MGKTLRHHITGCHPLHRGWYVVHYQYNKEEMTTDILYWNGGKWAIDQEVADHYGPFDSFAEASMWERQNGRSIYDPGHLEA